VSWPATRLADLVDAKPGFACGEDVRDGVFQFRMNNVTPEGALDLSRQRRVPADSRRLDSFLLQPGDVLFNATNSPELVGKTAFFPGFQEPATYSNHFLRLRPTAAIDGRFLARWLTFQHQRRLFMGMCRQWVNQASVNRDALLNLTILVPPLSEQKRIAAILDQADGLRAKRSIAITELNGLTYSIFVDMFGSLTSDLAGFPLAPLGTVAEIQGGLQVTSKRKTNPKEVPYLRVANVYRGSLDLSEVKTLRVTDAEVRRSSLIKGDLLVVEGHGNKAEIGRVAVWDGSIDPCVHQNHLIRVRCDQEQILPRLAEVYLNGVIGRRALLRAANTTSGLNTISTADVSAAVVPILPLKEQEKFVRAVSSVDAMRRQLTCSLDLAFSLFASLQHRAFRGEP
jgi:type I restriction enzyme S subunit